MTVHYLKRATSTSSSGDASVRDTVAGLLAALEAGREEEAKRQAELEAARKAQAEAEAAAREAERLGLHERRSYARIMLERSRSEQRIVELTGTIGVEPSVYR
jgi:membrane protein involved in colicin uptake